MEKGIGKTKKLKNEKKKEESKEISNETKAVIIGLIALVAIFIGCYFIFSGIGKVKYEGLVFIKEKAGNLDIYHHIREIWDLNGKNYAYNLYLRKDPRLNSVQIETDDELTLERGRVIVLGINSTNLGKCEEGTIATGTLVQYLGYINYFLNVKVGVPDKNESVEKNTTYVSCNSYPANSVIIIEESSENITKIIKNNNCYRIKVANCEILDATEKFIVETLVEIDKSEGK